VSEVLPVPVPLPDPPGSASALVAALESLAAAGWSAGLLRHLLEPVAVLHGWTGADATVAATEVAAATGVAADLHRAVTTALLRLDAHAQAWMLVERRLAVLRQRQADQFAAASARLARLAGPLGAMTGGPPPPGAAAVVAEVLAEENARAAEYQALLADLAQDAHRSVAALADAASPLGGAGRPGETARVTVRLAQALPGWGERAMATLGLAAAADLTTPGPLAQMTGTANRYVPYSDTPAFADALIQALGTAGLTYLMAVLGSVAGTGAGAELAGLLARTLGAVDGAGAGAGPVLRAGELLDPRNPGADALALGMGAVLAAPAAGPRLAASWGRALLERDQAQGAGAVARTTAGLPDPVEAAVQVLLRSADGPAAAALLTSSAAWGEALARNWPDDGVALAAVIDLGAGTTGAASTARAALQALGQGLAPGSQLPALDDRRLRPAVRDALGRLVAAQAGAVVADLGRAVVADRLDARQDAGLRGLGLLLSQPGQDAGVTGALTAALRGGTAGGVAGEVAGAHVAVQEYGQRVRHALDCARELANAVDRQLNWTIAVTIPSLAVGGRAGELLTGIEGVGARALRADGAVVYPPDRGRRYTAEDAARLAESVAGGTGASARSAFGRVTELLGVPREPSPDSLLDVLDEVDPPDRRQSRRGRGR
jgi:hypothetical protein